MLLGTALAGYLDVGLTRSNSPLPRTEGSLLARGGGDAHLAQEFDRVCVVTDEQLGDARLFGAPTRHRQGPLP
eukprot:8897228-Lingulodinium_polyedra.AAC.1